jgi:hypothetical protein
MHLNTGMPGSGIVFRVKWNFPGKIIGALGHEGWILKILEIPGRMCRRSSKTKHPMVQTHMFHNKTATLGYFRGTVCSKFKHIHPRFQIVEPKARSKTLQT